MTLNYPLSFTSQDAQPKGDDLLKSDIGKWFTFKCLSHFGLFTEDSSDNVHISVSDHMDVAS